MTSSLAPQSNRIAGTLAAAILGVALLAAPQTASAQTQSPAPSQAAPARSTASPAPAAPKPRRTRVDRVEARIASLHTQLMVTPDQEPQWQQVAQAMHDDATTTDRLARQRYADRTKMSAVDDLRSYQAIADAHAAGLKQLVPAFQALYDKMSDAQKKNADKVFAHTPRRPRTKRS